ncbi:Sphingomyelin phosphodiesterase [Meloidogyne graminicola]|uniref:Sphingomyelin phosphodiesterase n=1 Tax=Meloidogyne graminicola TaxID=189291 RepID=A0A8S9ZX85_9BILA|nr:Sphingomyelin phosphodiesterase [Meloidogyne graminicola]
MYITYYFIFFTFFCFYTSHAFNWKCAGCKTGVEVLRYLYEQNYTTTEILKTAEYVCRHFADQDSFVCRGITSQFKDEFLYVLGKLVFQPSQLCGLILNSCGTPINPFDTNWNISLPPSSSINLKSSKKTTKPIHYLEGSEAECGKPVCCIKKPRKGMPIKKKSGYWGTTAKCDIPLRTVENLLGHINKTHKVDFVLLSGDYVHHRDWEYTHEGHISTIANLSILLQKHLSEIPIFWAIGNHEAVPVNAFGPNFVPERFRPTWIYKAILNEAHKTDKGKLPVEADERSYSINYGNNLRIISLNNGYCDNTNMFIYINQTDPDGSLTWLVNQLWDAEKNEKFVYILSHIPPGDEECLESWSRNYYRII